jgi:glutathione S-transferase
VACHQSQLIQAVARQTGKQIEVRLLTEAERFSKEFKQKNPFDRYPVLEAEEGVLYDTLAICKYLANGTGLTGSNRL